MNGHWRQSTAMLEMASAAALGGFVVPRCTQCDHRFYPPQTWCPRCLHGNVGFAPDSGLATVISMTELRMSLDAAWKGAVPIHVACIRTHSGLSMFALAEERFADGAEVIAYMAPPQSKLPALVCVRARQREENTSAN